MSSERPILFSGEMVRAILEGRKTQTRRVMKPQPDTEFPCVYDRECPYGKIGDTLWVRETWGVAREKSKRIVFRAGDQAGKVWPVEKWRPSIHIPKRASRITLEITNVRVERLQDITEEDAKAEGPSQHPKYPQEFYCSWKAAYKSLWDSINAKRGFGWDVNPWVWVIEFKRLQKTS